MEISENKTVKDQYATLSGVGTGKTGLQGLVSLLKNRCLAKSSANICEIGQQADDARKVHTVMLYVSSNFARALIN